MFSYDGLDRFAGRIDAASADLEPGRWRLTDAWISGADGLPQHHATLRPADGTDAGADPGKLRLARHDLVLGPAALHRQCRRRGLLGARATGSTGIRCWRLPLLFSAMVFMAASFSFRFSRLGGVPQLVLAAILSGFGVYFLDTMTEALGRSGILPTPLAAVAPVGGGDPARHDIAFSRGRRVKRTRGLRGRHRYFRTACAATALMAVAVRVRAPWPPTARAAPQQILLKADEITYDFERAHRDRARQCRNLRPGPHAPGRSGHL